MKITGVALKQAIHMHKLRSETAAGAFHGTLVKFPDDEKDPPQKIVEEYLKAERAIAKLETAQTRYNLHNKCEVLGETMSLEEVIKRIGGPARAEKFWRTAAAPERDRYHREPTTREAGQVIAKPTILPSEAMKLAFQQAKIAGAFRAALAVANAREVEIEDLDPALFE